MNQYPVVLQNYLFWNAGGFTLTLVEVPRRDHIAASVIHDLSSECVLTDGVTDGVPARQILMVAEDDPRPRPLCISVIGQATILRRNAEASFLYARSGHQFDPASNRSARTSTGATKISLRRLLCGP
jgi:hypothetical protein